MPDVIYIYVSCPDMHVARTIGREMVHQRYAASVNILPQMQSIYRWGGEIVEADECVLLIKTTAPRFDDIRIKVREMHPYQMPCITAFPITQGDPPYLEWVGIGSTAGAVG
jgi:periplasmic divalent cation tolerance protein